jgi:hypothetical protein
MPSRFPRRLARLCALTAVSAGVLVTPAGAATRLDFELSPAGGGSYPRFTARAGETVTGALRLRSRIGKVQTIRLQALDLGTAHTGGIEFRPGRAAAVGAWLKLERRDVRLPGGATRTVRFTASIPRDAAPGEHFAGIAAIDRAELRRAQSPAGRRGVELRHVTRVALPVRLELRGSAERQLDLRGIGFSSNAGGTRLELDLRSIGHLLVRETSVDLRVSGPGARRPVRHRDRISEFVPQTAIRYPIALPGQVARGEYRVTGTIKPEGGRTIRVDERVSFGSSQAKELEERTGDTVPGGGGVPKLLIGALALALLLAGAASAGYVRLRRRLRRATAAAGRLD